MDLNCKLLQREPGYRFLPDIIRIPGGLQRLCLAFAGPDSRTGSTYAYVNPVIAVLLGVFFAGEHMTLLQISGLVVILVSVFLINIAKYRNERKKVKDE